MTAAKSPTAWLDEIEKERPLNQSESRAKPWFAIDGDRTLRLDYKLSLGSIVYDVGGYEGEWASKIYQRYKCHVEVFEPVKSFVEKLEKKFASTDKVKVYGFGLAGRTRRTSINLDDASSSTFKAGKKPERVELVKAGDFIKPRLRKIDLMKINIEGGEYELLDHLIESGLVKNIADIQVQFHDFVPGAEKKTPSAARKAV